MYFINVFFWSFKNANNFLTSLKTSTFPTFGGVGSSVWLGLLLPVPMISNSPSENTLVSIVRYKWVQLFQLLSLKAKKESCQLKILWLHIRFLKIVSNMWAHIVKWYLIFACQGVNLTNHRFVLVSLYPNSDILVASHRSRRYTPRLTKYHYTFNLINQSSAI